VYGLLHLCLDLEDGKMNLMWQKGFHAGTDTLNSAENVVAQASPTYDAYTHES